MKTLRLLALAGLVLSGAACIETVQPSRERSGYVSAIAHSGGGGTYLLRLTGAFYRADELSSNLDAPETCVAVPYSAQVPTLGSFPTLNAGQFLFTNVAGRTDTLFQVNVAGLLTYQLQSVPGIPFAVGDSLALTVPGDVQGFPALQAKVRVAEPFTYDPVGTATDGATLPITWTPAAVPGSLMIFSLRYNSSGVSDEPDAQIYCVFLDDGSAEIQQSYAAAWSASSPPSRSVYASRVRRSRVEVDARTRMTLYSFFDVPAPALPSP